MGFREDFRIKARRSLHRLNHTILCAGAEPRVRGRKQCQEAPGISRTAIQLPWSAIIIRSPSESITIQAASDQICNEPELREQRNEYRGKQLIPCNLNVIML